MKKIIYLILFYLSMGLYLISGSNQPIEKEPDSFNIKKYAGSWTGHGAGEEVRYRHKLGLLTLTVKHKTEFVFVIKENGIVEGEGSIEYDLTNNTTGLDNLVASVHALMGLAGSPALSKSKFGDSISDKSQKGVDHIRDIDGVTKIQYNAPHLKFGKEVRHFKFTGRIEEQPEKIKNKKIYIYIDKISKFYLPDGKEDITLIAEYEVNKVKEESKFPCWSPFLIKPGIIRKGPGDLHIAEFMEKGKHRQNKKVWEEFGYVWLTRQITTQSQNKKKGDGN